MVVSQFGRTFVKIIHKTSRDNVQLYNPIAASAAVLCFELAKNPDAFPWPYYFFLLVCVVIWAIKNDRSFIVLSAVRSFDGHFKASIIYGTEFFTTCFCLRVLWPFTSICNSCAVSQTKCWPHAHFLLHLDFFMSPSRTMVIEFIVSGSMVALLDPWRGCALLFKVMGVSRNLCSITGKADQ